MIVGAIGMGKRAYYSRHVNPTRKSTLNIKESAMIQERLMALPHSFSNSSSKTVRRLALVRL